MQRAVRQSGGGVICIAAFLGILFASNPTLGLPISQQAYFKASNTGSEDFFGISVAISGDTMVVGAPNEDSSSIGVNGPQTNNGAVDSGATYVFVRVNGIWTQQAYLKASNTNAGDEFGQSVAISGDTIVVGARMEESASNSIDGNQNDNSKMWVGAAYVFVRSAGTWTQQAYLKASNADEFDLFGCSVAISGNTIVVGAHNENSGSGGVNGDQLDESVSNSGAAYVFVRNGGVWTQQAYLKASTPGQTDWFGEKVAISGNTIVVGASLEDGSSTGVNGNQADNGAEDAGAAYVFERIGSTWYSQAYLKASNTGADDRFGNSISISGETIVVGASLEDSSGTGVNGNQGDSAETNSGAAYVFARTSGIWTQQAYLKSNDPELNDYFGNAAISGNTIVVGSFWEDGGSTGVDGNQFDNSVDNSGAGFLFTRSGTNWAFQNYLKASNTGDSDLLGSAAAIAGGTVVLGAFREDSARTGVDNNNTHPPSLASTDSGAVYVFAVQEAMNSLDATPPSLDIKGKRKRVTSRSRIKLKGVAFDDVAVALVRFRDSRKGFRNAKLRSTGVPSSGRWQLRALLNPDRRSTTVRIMAFDSSGNPSKSLRVRVRRP